MRRLFLLAALCTSLAVCALLGACGTRGPLTLPPAPAKAATTTEASTSQSKQAADLSTTQEAAR